MSAPWQGYVRDLVTRAYYQFGYLAPGDTLSPTDGPVAVNELIALIDSFGVDRLLIWHIVISTFSLVANQQTYTIGQGGDFDIDRPIWIDNASMIDPTNEADPLEIPLAIVDPDEWAQVRLKLLTSTWPTTLYYDYQFATDATVVGGGLGNILLWPTPTNANLQLRLYCATPMTQITDLNTQIRLPPGYLDFVVKNLAVRLSVIMGREVSPLLLLQAQEAEGKVKRANVRPMDIVCDPALTGPGTRQGGWSWRSDTP